MCSPVGEYPLATCFFHNMTCLSLWTLQEVSSPPFLALFHYPNLFLHTFQSVSAPLSFCFLSWFVPLSAPFRMWVSLSLLPFLVLTCYSLCFRMWAALAYILSFGHLTCPFLWAHQEVSTPLLTHVLSPNLSLPSLWVPSITFNALTGSTHASSESESFSYVCKLSVFSHLPFITLQIVFVKLCSFVDDVLLLSHCSICFTHT